MTKRKAFIIIICVVIFWTITFFVDYYRVINGDKPCFCVNTGNSHYSGIIYSFDIITHPLTEKNEFALYFFGALAESSVTNSV